MRAPDHGDGNRIAGPCRLRRQLLQNQPHGAAATCGHPERHVDGHGERNGDPGRSRLPDCTEPVTANFTQSGASVEGTLKDSSYSNCFGVYTPSFRGTLEGRNLGGVIHFLGGDPGVAASGQVEGERDDRLTLTTVSGQRMVWDLRR